jgi:phosphopantetheine adenylyltransferase
MPPRNYSNITVRREVREELDKLREELNVRDFSDILALLVRTYREYTSVTSKLVEHLTSISSKVDELLTRVSSIATSNASISTSDKTPATSNTSIATSISSSLESKQYATQSSKRITAWDILKRDKISCISNIKARNPSRVIETLFENGAVKINLEHDVCIVYPDFWWEFWNILNRLKTPNDEENVKEFKDEKMKWLYSTLRKEGVIVLDSARKPPVWTFDKRVEIPEKAFEAKEEQKEEAIEETEEPADYIDYDELYQ